SSSVHMLDEPDNCRSAISTNFHLSGYPTNQPLRVVRSQSNFVLVAYNLVNGHRIRAGQRYPMNTKCFQFLAAKAALSVSMLTVLTAPGFAIAAAPMAAATDLQPFAGTWIASHDGTRIVELVLRVEKGNLAGAIRICG